MITSDDPDESSVAVSLAGTGIEPDIAVPASLDYGPVVTFTTATLQLQIDNLGTSTLNVSNITSDDPAFVPQQTTAAVAPGGLALIDIEFSPLVTGPFAGTLTITSDDPDEASVAVALSGTGIEPDIAVPVSLDFGEVGVFTTSTLQLQIDNLGTSTLNVSDISSDDPAFVPQQTTAVVAPGGMALIDVDFSPLVTGAIAGTLTITSDDPDAPAVAVALSGDGVVLADIQVPASLGFGSVTIITTASQQLQIDNVGTGTLDVTGISSDHPAFVPQQTTAAVAPGGMALIDVEFTPLATGSIAGTLTITSNDPDEPSVGVPVSGVGVEPDIAVPATLDLGVVAVGLTGTVQLQIDNTGDGTLEVTNITSDEASFVPQQTTVSIPPAGTALIGVDFSPTASGTATGMLTITSNDPDEGSVDVALTGEGGPVALFLNPTSIEVAVAGTPGTLRAFHLFDDGTLELATSAAGNLPSFQSSDVGVMDVLSNGTLIPVAPGSATITASYAGLAAVTTVTVHASSSVDAVTYAPSDLILIEVGETLQVTAFAIDDLGNTTDTVDLLSSNAAVLSVDSIARNIAFATAQVSGLSGGVADLTIRSQTDPNVFQVVEVHVVDPVSLTLVPEPAAVTVGGVEQCLALGVGTDGTHTFALPDPVVTWSSSAPAIAPVFPNGKLVGLAVGSATVTAVSVADPGVQGSTPVTVSAGSALPQVVLSGLGGEDIVANGANMGTAIYGRVNQGGGTIVSVPSVEKVFIIENDVSATGDLEVVFVETDTDRLLASVSPAPIPPERIGALVLEVTLPTDLIDQRDDNLGPISGTATLYTNDPNNHQIDISVSWFWAPADGVQPDASTAMFLDFGEIPSGESVDRTFVFDTGENSQRVLFLTPAGAGFSLRNPNPNPFMSDSFPATQTNVDVPLTFTIRAAPNAASGTFVGSVRFGNDDPDEGVLDALMVAYGVPAQTPVLPMDLAYATSVDTRLETTTGSERIVVSVPSGDDGLAYDAATGVSYLYSKLAGQADPAANGTISNAFVFKAPASGKPQVIKDNLSEDVVAFAADFTQNVTYFVNPTQNGNDLLRLTDAGSVSIVLADVFTLNSKLGTDSGGNIYISEAFENFQPAITKYSFAGTQLLRFAGTSTVRQFDIEADVIYTELGQKFDASANPLGSFTIIPDFEWFTADDGPGNVLFSDGSGGSGAPQALTLETPGGTLQGAGTLPRKAFQGDF
jgi:hypothetical protein